MSPLTLGWREWLSLPKLGIAAIQAKIDSGARSSALHVESWETYDKDGIEHVRFTVRTGVGDELRTCRAKVVDRRPVTDSGGHVSERIFIRTALAIAGLSHRIEINLTNRRNMLFPMLLGRTAMARRYVIDPGRSYVHGDRAPPEPPA